MVHVVWLLPLLIAVASPLSSQTDGDRVKPPPSETEGVLDIIPGDAWAVVGAPDIGRLTDKFDALAKATHLPAAMGNSLMTVKVLTGLLFGVDDHDGAAIALLPFADFKRVGASIVILVPTTDFDALIKSLNPSTADGGVQRITFLGRESFVGLRGRIAVFGQTPDVVKLVLNSTTTFRDSLAGGQIDRYRSDDLSLMIHLGAIARSDWISGLIGSGSLSSGEGSWLRTLRRVQVSLRLEEQGVAAGIFVDIDPRSDIGRCLSVAEDAEGSPLATLPQGEVIVAAGWRRSAERSVCDTRLVTRVLEERIGGADGPSAGLRDVLPFVETLVGRSRDIAVSVMPATDESYGMVSVAVVVRSDHQAAAMRQTFADLFRVVKRNAPADSRLAEVVNLLNYVAAAEHVDDVPVDHLVFNLPAETEAYARTMLAELFGEQGLRVRVAAVDDAHVALTFGGGLPLVREVISVVRGRQPSLRDDDRFNASSATTGSISRGELYFSPGVYSRWLEKVLAVVGEPPPLRINYAGPPLSVVVLPAEAAASWTQINAPMGLTTAVIEALTAPRDATDRTADSPARGFGTR